MYFGVVKNGVCACVCVCGEEMEGGENLDKILKLKVCRKLIGSVRVNDWGVEGINVTMQW